MGTWYVALNFFVFRPFEYSFFFGSIIGSLAGCSYWGPVAGHGLLTHDLDLLRDERKKFLPERQGTVSGDFEAVPATEEAERYTVVRKRKPEQE